MGGDRCEPAEAGQDQIVDLQGHDQHDFVRRRAVSHAELDRQDFYELFGLPRYAELPHEEHSKTLNKTFRRLALQWHPDKNAAADKKLCNTMMDKIFCAKGVLEDPGQKQRYDKELRQIDKKGDKRSITKEEWLLRWGFNVVTVAGGLGLTIASAIGAPFTAGCTVPVGIAGSALLNAGISGTSKMLSNPDCSGKEFLKDASVGLAIGAATGGIGVAAGATMKGATAAAKLGHAAWAGAATYAAQHVGKDAVDLAITNCLSEETKMQFSDTKSNEQIFSVENGIRLVGGAIFGACAGMAVQGLVNAFTPSVKGDGNLVDDAVNAVSKLKGKTGPAAITDRANKAAALVHKNAGKTFKVAEKMLKRATAILKAQMRFTLAGTAKRLLSNGAGVGVSTAGSFAIETGIGVSRARNGGHSIAAALELVLPSALWGSAKQLALGAVTASVASVIQHAAEVSQAKVEMKTLKKLHGQCRDAKQLLADMKNKELSKQALDRLKGKADVAANEHSNERHLGPRQQAEARAKVKADTSKGDKVSPSSVFYDGEDFKDSIQQGVREIRGKGNGKMTIDVKVRCPVGVAVKYDADSKSFLYTECSTARVVCKMEDGKALLVTCYPTPGKNAVWQQAPPQQQLMFEPPALGVKLTAALASTVASTDPSGAILPAWVAATSEARGGETEHPVVARDGSL